MNSEKYYELWANGSLIGTFDTVEDARQVVLNAAAGDKDIEKHPGIDIREVDK